MRSRPGRRTKRGHQAPEVRGRAGRTRLLAACAVALLAPLAVPCARAAGSYQVPRPVVTKLENGLVVMVFPDPRLPVVQVRLRAAAGVEAEPAGQSGVASATARLLGRGTTSREPAVFADEIARLGTALSADVGREYATLSCAFLSRDLESGLELVADAVIHPVFREDEVRRAVSQAARGVLQLHRDPLATADEQLWTLALPGVPAAGPPRGTVESLALLKRDQVSRFYLDRYRPASSVLAIAGDVTPERARSAAAEWFGSWAGGGAPPLPPARPPQRKPEAPRIRVVDQAEAGPCAIALGLTVPGRASPDVLARSVAGRVFDRWIEGRPGRGPASEVRSSLELTRDHGLWSVQVRAPAESAAVLVRRLGAEWRQFLSAAAAAADVDAEKHRIRRGFPLAFETAAGQMGQWLFADFAGFPADYFDRYPARVAALTPQELHAAATRGADAAHPFVVAVGPARRLVPVLEKLGSVEVVSLDSLPGPAPLPGDTLPPPTAEQRSKGRTLVTRTVSVHGGLESLAGVRTSLVDAKAGLTMSDGEASATLRQVRKDPYKMALVTSMQGVDTRQVLNGSRSFTVVAESDTVLEGDSLSVATLRIGYVSDLPHVLVAAADPKARVAARGRERIAGRETEKVEVVSESGPWRMLYLDPASYRLIAFDQVERGARGPFVTRRVYGDYRPVEGIQWPYREERFAAGQLLLRLDVTGVRLNLELSEEHFEPPRTGGASRR